MLTFLMLVVFLLATAECFVRVAATRRLNRGLRTMPTGADDQEEVTI